MIPETLIPRESDIAANHQTSERSRDWTDRLPPGWVQLIGRLRRLWLVYARRGYVTRQMEIRQGECLQCGACCKLVWRCPMLKPDNLCRAYGVCRDLICKSFPIDQRDIRDAELNGARCGYSFPK